MSEYTIDCTGDVVTGDEVEFERATFTGSWRRPKFAGMETVRGRIVNDSYGAAKQQHTFTLELPDGTKTTIKGRNLYRNGCHRKPWPNEADREAARAEKHDRGNIARQRRELRRMAEGMDLTTFAQVTA
jgi:hypothetical protein